MRAALASQMGFAPRAASSAMRKFPICARSSTSAIAPIAERCEVPSHHPERPFGGCARERPERGDGGAQLVHAAVRRPQRVSRRRSRARAVGAPAGRRAARRDRARPRRIGPRLLRRRRVALDARNSATSCRNMAGAARNRARASRTTMTPPSRDGEAVDVSGSVRDAGAVKPSEHGPCIAEAAVSSEGDA